MYQWPCWPVLYLRFSSCPRSTEYTEELLLYAVFCCGTWGSELRLPSLSIVVVWKKCTPQVSGIGILASLLLLLLGKIRRYSLVGDDVLLKAGLSFQKPPAFPGELFSSCMWFELRVLSCFHHHALLSLSWSLVLWSHTPNHTLSLINFLGHGF